MTPVQPQLDSVDLALRKLMESRQAYEEMLRLLNKFHIKIEKPNEGLYAMGRIQQVLEEEYDAQSSSAAHTSTSQDAGKVLVTRGGVELHPKRYVRNCPHRCKQRDAPHNEKPIVWHSCASVPYYVGQSLYSDVCRLRGNTRLDSCKIYNDWSYNEVKKAFARLEELEKRAETVRAVMRL